MDFVVAKELLHIIVFIESMGTLAEHFSHIVMSNFLGHELQGTLEWKLDAMAPVVPNPVLHGFDADSSKCIQVFSVCRTIPIHRKFVGLKFGSDGIKGHGHEPIALGLLLCLELLEMTPHMQEIQLDGG